MIVGALELGGSHISAAHLELETAEVDRVSRRRLDPSGTRRELLDSILDAARSISTGVSRVGVAVPGPFDHERGVCTIRGVGKLEGLFGTDLRSELSRVFETDPLAIRFLNDAEAFLLGEAHAGSAKGHERAIGITLGTGLGSAFLVDSEIVHDDLGVPAQGNLHLVSFRGGPVEDVISGRAFQTRFGASAEAIALRASRGDQRASAAFAQFGRDLGEFLRPHSRRFEPTCIVIGGSIARAWSQFGSELRSSLGGVPVEPAMLAEPALLGAALHAVQDVPPTSSAAGKAEGRG